HYGAFDGLLSLIIVSAPGKLDCQWIYGLSSVFSVRRGLSLYYRSSTPIAVYEYSKHDWTQNPSNTKLAILITWHANFFPDQYGLLTGTVTLGHSVAHVLHQSFIQHERSSEIIWDVRSNAHMPASFCSSDRKRRRITVRVDVILQSLGYVQSS
ncbi:hypothetical protein CVT26_006065, partial [Gymnopilus dilepis]